MMDQSNKPVIVYDLALCPKDVKIESIIKAFTETGFIFYDSTLARGAARPPYTLNGEELNPEIMVDISTVEFQEFLKKLNKNG